MDAFYASVEQRDFPELKGKPVAVGGSKDRGVVAAASYEYRKYGVRSAMPSRTAFRLCPDIIFVKPRFEVYKAVSEQIRAIFLSYTDLVEPLSLDEAYLDVTENKKGHLSATLIAKEIKARILEETQLTASAGVSINKFVAKIASDENKPNGICTIPPDEVHAFIDQLSIAKFHGVGKVMTEKLHKMGVRRGRDLKQFKERQLVERFGKQGHYLYTIAHGNDQRPVNPNRIRKSVGAENTYGKDLILVAQVKEKLEAIVQKVEERLKNSGKYGKTLTLKVKFSDFSQSTRSITQAAPFVDKIAIYNQAYFLFKEWEDVSFRIRLLGITISNFDEKVDVPKKELQLTLNF
jgi:DNA polymerase-4